jgi:ketosteroid isomerase-like protein
MRRAVVWLACGGLMVGRVLAQAPSAADAPPPAAGTVPTVALPAEIDRVLRDYERAWRSHDAAALSALFAEDGFVLGSGRPPVRGRAAIREAYAKAGGPLDLRPIAFATDGALGYVVGMYSHGAGQPETGKFVLALKRDGGRWLIAADMDNSSRPAPRPSPLPSPAAK